MSAPISLFTGSKHKKKNQAKFRESHKCDIIVDPPLFFSVIV